MLTPEKAILKTEASFAAIPAYDGEIGIKRDRAPLLCRLGIGVVRLDTPEGPKKLFVDAGFAEVDNNNVTLLTEQAATAEQVDVSTEQAALAEARARKATSVKDLEARRREIERASAKIKLVSGE